MFYGVRYAAKQNNGPQEQSAQCKMAIDSGVPDNIQQNHKLAFEPCSKAAQDGDPKAQLYLGFLYFYGQGVPQDNKRAFAWFTKAATQGDANAQLNLGLKYATGEGIAQDYIKASEWLSKAAEQGNSMAQFNLGGLYYFGRGVTQDYPRPMRGFLKLPNKVCPTPRYNWALCT